MGPDPTGHCAGPANFGTLRTMSASIRSLIIFVLILVALNFVLGEMGYGIHISIIGSIVLTLVVSLVMNAISSGRR